MRAKSAPIGFPSTASPARSAPIGVNPAGSPERRSSSSCMLRRARGSGDGGEPERSSLERVRERGGSRTPRCRAPLRRPRRPGCRQQRRARARPPSRSRSTASCALPCRTARAAERQRILQPPRPVRARAARCPRAARGSRTPPTHVPGTGEPRRRGDRAASGSRRTPRGVSATAAFAASRRRVASAAARAAAPDRERARRAERQRVARRERRRRDAGSPERLAAVQHVTVELGAAEAHEGQGEMGERREVCLSDGADRRYDRVHAAVEHPIRGRRRPPATRRSRRPRGPRRARSSAARTSSVEAGGPSAAARPTRMRRARSGSSAGSDSPTFGPRPVVAP